MNKIQEALFQQDFNTVLELLKQGEKWEVDNFTANQAYENSIKSEQFDLLNHLIKEEIILLDIFEYDSFKNSLFEILTKIPITDTIEKFINELIEQIENIDDELETKTWLGLAIENNAVKLVTLLSENGCDLHNINGNEENYLFLTEDVTMTENLINNGLDINKKNIAGKTVFFKVVASKNKELIQLYLDNGIDVNSQDNQGETIYDIICFQLIDAEIFEYIANFDPPRFDLKNNDGQSLFFKFANRVSWDNEIKIFKMMLDSGANLFQEEIDGYGNTITISDVLAIKPIAILEMLSENGYLEIDAIDNKGNSWLHKVCKEDLNFEQDKAKEMYRKVKLLLKSGANPTLKNDEDKSPIDYAQEDNLKVKVLQILIKS